MVLELAPHQDPIAVHHLGMLLADAARNRHAVAVQLAVQGETTANCHAILVTRAEAEVVGCAVKWAESDRADLALDDLEIACRADHLANAVARLRAARLDADLARSERSAALASAPVVSPAPSSDEPEPCAPGCDCLECENRREAQASNTAEDPS